MTDPLPTPDLQSGFAALGVAAPYLETLSALGYEEPTPVQRAAIPPLLLGRDVLGQAATGTGKTAAFALPLLQRNLDETPPKPNRPRALVLVPTRELAVQVAEAIYAYSRERRGTVLPIYGGQSIVPQFRALDRGVSCVVATPGRALDHLERGSLSFDDLRTIVLDEADEMLDVGFADDLDAILKRAPAERQTALFSATLPPRIMALVEGHMRDPVRVRIAAERPALGEAPKVRETAYVVGRPYKAAALGRILDVEAPTAAIVFCRTRLEVDDLTEAMGARGYRAEALHGGMAQDQRERVLGRFKSEKSDLLVATDVAARGLDIEHLSHVVNYDVPSDPETYVHRVGRTGRAGREGVALTLVEPRERRLLRNIETAVRRTIALAPIPSVADLRVRRMESLKNALKETIERGELGPYRELVSELSASFDPTDVAAAAARLAHAESGGTVDDEREFPTPEIGPRRGDRRGPDDGAEGGPQRRRRDAAPPREGFERVFIGAGRFESIRPGDLVGAIAGESGLGRDVVGSVRIADRFSIVEVAAEHVEHVIRSLRKASIRGRRPIVRRDRES
jgi:ATP-dependent RNA helicase DeaD